MRLKESAALVVTDRSCVSILGYAVTTMSDRSTEYFVAGAPRSNHSGQVIVYTVGGQKQLSVVDSERGKQVPGAQVFEFPRQQRVC